MKITKAIRLKEGNSLLGLSESYQLIHVTVYSGSVSIIVETPLCDSFKLYLEDNENYEPVSIYSFNRMLRLAQYRINNFINV